VSTHRRLPSQIPTLYQAVMRRLLTLLVALAIACPMAFGTPGAALAHNVTGKPAPPKLSEKEEQRLRKGKLVLRTDRGKAEGSGLITGIIEIDATTEDVWKLLVQFELVPVASKAVKETVRYVDEPGAGSSRSVGIRYLIKVAWVDITYHIHHDIFPDQHYLHWTLDKDRKNEIEKTDGSYSLWPGSGPGKVRFLYITEVKTGRNIPEWVEEELTESSLKRFLVFVKKRAEG